MANPLSAERRAQIEGMLADGCSHREIARTLGVDRHPVNLWYPGTGWDHRQSGAFGRACRGNRVRPLGDS